MTQWFYKGGSVIEMESLFRSSWLSTAWLSSEALTARWTKTSARRKQSSLMLYIIGKYKCRSSNNCVTAASKKILRRRSRLAGGEMMNENCGRRLTSWRVWTKRRRLRSNASTSCAYSATLITRVCAQALSSDANAGCVLIEREDRCTSRGPRLQRISVAQTP